MVRPPKFQYPEAVYHVMARGDFGKQIFAGKEDFSVKNDWLASRLRMGHPAAMSQLVSRTLKDPKSLKILEKHEITYKSKD